ncbi:MAG: DnaA/Hda family protein [Planctomycetota bacterium]|nr:DnaA/Hda family protein [Planctomycetota bacterium]
MENGLENISRLIAEWRKIAETSLLLKFKTPDAREKFVLQLLSSAFKEEPLRCSLSLPLKPAFTFETFKSTEGSKMAHLMCLAASEGLQEFSTPVTLVGPHGCGKTHLLQAAVARRQKRDSRTLSIYTTAENFVNLFIAYRKQKEEFLSPILKATLLAIDDIHFLEEKPRSAEEIASLCRSILSNKGTVIFSTSEQLGRLKQKVSALSGLLTESIVCTINLPLPYERKEIIRLKSELLGVNLPANAVEDLSDSAISISEVEGLLLRYNLTGNLPLKRTFHSLLKQIEENLTAAGIRNGGKLAPSVMIFLLKKKGFDNTHIMRVMRLKSLSSVNYAVKRVEKLIESTILTSHLVEELLKYVDESIT